MSKLKSRTLAFVLAIILAAGVGFAAYTLLKSDGSAPPPAAQDQEPEVSPESLVTFPDEQAKQEFLENNGLGEDDLTPAGGLDNTYVVPVPQDELESGESDVKPRREYQALLTPNDTIYPQWYSTKINAPAAWDVTTGSSTVTVAVIDTGFALSHEDMAGRWAVNSGEFGGGKESNGLDDDSNGLIDDWRGWDYENDDNDPSAGTISPSNSNAAHGTVVSGLVGATGNNGLGIAGVSWGTSILPLQALGDDGGGFTENIVAAVNYAVARGAKVINLSLGSTDADPLLEAAVNNAVSAGVTVIAAAGNCGDPNSYIANGCDHVGQILYPARYPNVIAVGASTESDGRASFSSYGSEIDILAPGAGTIRSTNWSQANPTSLYTSSASGTSIAAPVVSGTAALMYSHLGNLTPAQIKSGLLTTADKLSEMGGQNQTDQHGFGRLDTHGSVTINNLPCPNTLIPSYNISAAAMGERLVPLASGPGQAQSLHVILPNKTGTGCVESHGWLPAQGQWFSHIASNRAALDPADADIISADLDGDGRDELLLIQYQNTGSGRIEVHGWTHNLQQWILHTATNRPAIDPADAEVIAADLDGDGRDELLLIQYQNTTSGKVEVHGWTGGFQGWFMHTATNHSAVSPSVSRLMAADLGGDGKDELYLVNYTSTASGKVEVHGWTGGLQSWFMHTATNHASLSPNENEVFAANITGGPEDEILLGKYQNSGSGRVEVHGWTGGFQGWFMHAAIP